MSTHAAMTGIQYKKTGSATLIPASMRIAADSSRVSAQLGGARNDECGSASRHLWCMKYASRRNVRLQVSNLIEHKA